MTSMIPRLVRVRNAAPPSLTTTSTLEATPRGRLGTHGKVIRARSRSRGSIRATQLSRTEEGKVIRRISKNANLRRPSIKPRTSIRRGSGGKRVPEPRLSFLSARTVWTGTFESHSVSFKSLKSRRRLTGGQASKDQLVDASPVRHSSFPKPTVLSPDVRSDLAVVDCHSSTDHTFSSHTLPSPGNPPESSGYTRGGPQSADTKSKRKSVRRSQRVTPRRSPSEDQATSWEALAYIREVAMAGIGGDLVPSWDGHATEDLPMTRSDRLRGRTRECNLPFEPTLAAEVDLPAMFDMRGALITSGQASGKNPANTPCMRTDTLHRLKRVKKVRAGLNELLGAYEAKSPEERYQEKEMGDSGDEEIRVIPSPLVIQPLPTPSPPEMNITISNGPSAKRYRLDSHVLAALDALQLDDDTPTLDAALAWSPCTPSTMSRQSSAYDTVSTITGYTAESSGSEYSVDISPPKPRHGDTRGTSVFVPERTRSLVEMEHGLGLGMALQNNSLYSLPTVPRINRRELSIAKERQRALAAAGETPRPQPCQQASVIFVRRDQRAEVPSKLRIADLDSGVVRNVTVRRLEHAAI